MRRHGCGTWILAAALAAGGCADPLSRDSTLMLRRQVLEAHRRQARGAADAATIEVTEPEGDRYLEDQPQRIEQLDEMSGASIYRGEELDLGEGLDGEPSEKVYLSLRQAVAMAVRNNLDVNLARLQPGISEAQLVAAEAVFDAVFFSNASLSKTDQPQAQFVNVDPATGQQFLIGQPVSITDTANLATGIRQPLDTGGQVTVQTAIDQLNNKTPGQAFVPDPSYTTSITLGLTQPVLRNFGTLVNRSQIMLSRNAHRRDLLGLHNQLLATVGDVEEAYWQLVQARYALVIQQRLLQRTLETRNTLRQRQQFDVNPVQMAQAQTRVEERRNDVLRARQTVRNASDRLKRLVNDPSMPIADERVLVPADDPVELPVQYNLLDAVTTALRERPDIRAALLGIDDASIRMAAADNQRLPLLNLNAQMSYRGLEGNPGNAVDELAEADFISYLVGAQFEAPIGNRAAEAGFRAARIARQTAVVQYRQAVQMVVEAIKRAMRDMRTSWQLIAINRSARRAAAETLRALLEREEKGEALTPEFLLDLKLNTQQRLADAELRELQSVVTYNIALARMQQFSGTLLERNQIELEWPEGMFAE